MSIASLVLSIVIFPFVLLALLILAILALISTIPAAIYISFIVATSPSGVTPPNIPENSLFKTSVPPWPLFRILVWLGEKFQNLADALTPPHVFALSKGTAWWEAKVAYAITKHGIADIIIEHGAVSSNDIAEKLGFHQAYTNRMLKAGEMIGFLTFDGSKFGLTDAGSTTSERESVTTKYMIEALNEKPYSDSWMCAINESLKTGESGIKEHVGIEVWEYFKDNQEAGEKFDKAMVSNTSQQIVTMVADYKFPEDAKICDIGGGVGRTLSGILEYYPKASGLVFDQPQVVEQAQDFLKEKKMLDRISAIGGDFFAELPGDLTDSDIFILKHILHDWGHDECVTILQNIAAVAKRGSKIVIFEYILGTNNFKTMETFKHLMDINMMAMCVPGACERTVKQYEQLVIDAHFKATTKFIPLRDALGAFEITIVEPPRISE